MPRKPIEWSKCIIYKIWKDDDFYVGSTTDFTNRKRSHKHICNNEKNKDHNCKIYKTIREKGGWTAWQMIPLEEYKECKNKIQSIIREEKWRVELNANLNSRKCFGAETIQEYNAQYYQQHKEEIKEYNAQYRQEHKEEIKEYNAQYKAQYHQDNADKIKEKKNQKFECNCGLICSISNKSRHEKTQKHQTYLATN